MIPAFAYTRARDLAEALTSLARPGAIPVAGGTDLLGCLRDGVQTAPHLVSLARLDALRGVAETAEGGLRIGALTPLAVIARHEGVRVRYRGLAQAAAAVASPQLRNQGTLGGNLCQRPRCWFFRGGYDCARKGGDTCYAMQGDNRYHAILGGSTCFIVHPSDTAVALTALDAAIGIAGPKGAREVPIEKFFVGPDEDMTKETVLAQGELVTDVLVPALPPGTRTAFRKVRARGAWDFALASAGVTLTLKGQQVTRARVVLGAAAPVPWRATAAERALVGQKLDARTVARAADAAVDGASPLEHNGYKVALFKGLVEEVLTGLMA